MFGYIYLTTNLINNKKYIGRHQSNGFDPNYFGSGKWLKKALKKFGIENFKCEILESINGVPTICDTEKDLFKSEEYYINYYNCVDSNEYYNLIPGGTGKCIRGTKVINNGHSYKRVLPEELNELISTGEWVIGGLKQSQETIDKRRLKNTGKKRTPETKHKISKALSGKVVSDEARKNLSISHKGKITWNAIKVRCIETGEIFNSLGEASRSVNRSPSNIFMAIKNNKTCANYHWAYYN